MGKMSKSEFHRLMAAALNNHTDILAGRRCNTIRAISLTDMLECEQVRDCAIAALFKEATGKDLQGSDLDAIMFDFNEEKK